MIHLKCINKNIILVVLGIILLTKTILKTYQQMPLLKDSIVLKKTKFIKKWLFWKRFKFFFLQPSNLSLFVSLKKIINQKKNLFFHFSNIYGRKFKHLIFTHSTHKILFGKRFYFVLSFLELRLNILLFRLRFFVRLLDVNLAILNGLIRINGKCIKKNIIIAILDIIIYKMSLKKTSRYNRFIWRDFKWNKWIVLSKKNGINRNWIRLKYKSKVFSIINYLEINYKLLGGCLVRRPFFGEILLGSNQLKYNRLLFKKIYFLY